MPIDRGTAGRAWVLAGIAMALVFWLMADHGPNSWLAVALKGSSVAALGMYALMSSRAPDARWIAAVMFAGAAGDIGIEVDTRLGGALFLLSHLIAMALYRRNRRPQPTGTQRAAAAALAAGVPLGGWLLTHDPLAAIYAIGLAAMAATAWLSRFSRYAVGIAALLFVASDLLIFARLGGVVKQSLTSWLVWPLYYAGQLLICTGVIGTLRRN